MGNQLHKRSFSLRRILMAIVLTVLLVLGGFAIYALTQAVSGVGKMMTPAEFEIDEADVNSYIGISLPNYATDFHAKGYNFMQSRIIALRVTVPSEKIDDFLSLVGFEEPLQDGMNPFHAGRLPEIEQFAWWNPDKATSYSRGSSSRSDMTGAGSFYDILVDKSHSEQYIIYLMVEQG